MTVLSQAEGDEILEILVRACEGAEAPEMMSRLARISILLGREVGAEKLKAIVGKGLDTAPINLKKG